MRNTRLFLTILTFLLPTFFVGFIRAQDNASTTEINLLAMGDWGTANAEQRVVANAMASYVEGAGKPFSGMLLAGDNFYVNLRGVNDPQWQTLFEQMYDRRRLNFPFYASLGNHDMMGSKYTIEMAYAKAHPDGRWKLPSRWYRLDFPSYDNPLLTVLMLDSNRSDMPAKMWIEEITWLGAQLADRRAKWVICCAHHPLYSNGDHGDNGVLQTQWGPFFARGHVDFYLCGHDHDLQHLEIPGNRTSFLLVGGGSAGRRAMRVDNRGPFSKSTYGFAHLQIQNDKATVRYVDPDGKVLHQFERNESGRVTVIDSAVSDKAIPRTVRSITRGEEDPAQESDLPATRPTTAP